MSFQITVLKVLAGQVDGRATLAELTRQVSILISSGPDWTDRTKRLAALAPGLSIFGSHFVTVDGGGWQITDAGRAFLLSLETPASAMSETPSTTAEFMPASVTAHLEPTPEASPPPSEGQHVPEVAAPQPISQRSTMMRLIGIQRRVKSSPNAGRKRRSR
ncbi:hypothetical protein JQ597_35260 [Bradyrhizobium sp. AUGA SZCCT0177]|uniref:hypothetical protein n=1 Tax=unclassified Bradyrhizobium TaxID=2631580 RepID=UPI001BABEC4E|nr:hypothetical protein [Bradyrhizobium sp. AUGA SZCCT0182]MBR1236411.1 hypothetical protein [Bradyrhizobium sp. AUGA SZCCT0182]MBR1287327.1 hypothetical protein [Bradyrhizobium sp. AUGA SZCCT0177]